MEADSTYDAIVVDPFERPAHIEIADLPGVPIGIKQDLEVAIIVSLKSEWNSTEPLVLVLSPSHASFDALDESSPFLFGHRRRDIRNQFSRPIGTNLLDPAVGDHSYDYYYWQWREGETWNSEYISPVIPRP